jgi:hypothetical protein
MTAKTGGQKTGDGTVAPRYIRRVKTG